MLFTLFTSQHKSFAPSVVMSIMRFTPHTLLTMRLEQFWFCRVRAKSSGRETYSDWHGGLRRWNGSHKTLQRGKNKQWSCKHTHIIPARAISLLLSLSLHKTYLNIIWIFDEYFNRKQSSFPLFPLSILLFRAVCAENMEFPFSLFFYFRVSRQHRLSFSRVVFANRLRISSEKGKNAPKAANNFLLRKSLNGFSWRKEKSRMFINIKT